MGSGRWIRKLQNMNRVEMGCILGYSTVTEIQGHIDKAGANILSVHFLELPQEKNKKLSSLWLLTPVHHQYSLRNTAPSHPNVTKVSLRVSVF